MSEPPPPETGHVRPTSAGVLVAWGLTGLVGGWLLRPLARRLADAAPVVTWPQVVALFLAALVLAVTAWTTHRAVRDRHLLEPHRAVNRLVLAKACALVGALVAGGYAGYAVSWLGLEAELAGQRVLRAGLAALGGVLTCAAALLLERACRVRDEGEDA
jgi:hypothetical protein